LGFNEKIFDEFLLFLVQIPLLYFFKFIISNFSPVEFEAKERGFGCLSNNRHNYPPDYATKYKHQKPSLSASNFHYLHSVGDILSQSDK